MVGSHERPACSPSRSLSHGPEQGSAPPPRRATAGQSRSTRCLLTPGQDGGGPGCHRTG
jgi:hypothetical protein